jgi:hypothetical protein
MPATQTGERKLAWRGKPNNRLILGSSSRASLVASDVRREVTLHMQNRADQLLAPGIERVLRQLDQDPEAPTSMHDPELHLALARLLRMRRALALAEVAPPLGAIVVGCRVQVRHEHKDKDEDEDDVQGFVIVAPGEGDPRTGRISCDSPPGQALLRRRVGDVVEALTPVGPRRLIVLHVDEWERQVSEVASDD